MYIPFLHALADEADTIALAAFRRGNLRVETKPDLSPVSEADQAIEARVRALATERLPGIGILGEEEGATGSTDRRLIIDPIDGTRNFVRGIPVFATLLALEVEGAIVAGLVSAPALGQRWHATQGGGAWCGGRRLAVSGISRWEDAQLFFGGLGGGEGVRPPEGFLTLAGKAARTRGFGDFWQHVLVAEGAGELAIDPELKPWDAAPLLLLVEEAGGRATTLSGERAIAGGSLVTSNGLLHESALRALRAG